MVKIYLASPFFSEEQTERVERVEKALKANPQVEAVFSPMRQQLDHLEFGSDEWVKAVFANDVKHIDWADVVVAVHDFTGETVLHGEPHSHVDSGTAWEMGYAYAKGKKTVIVHELGGIVNLMLSNGATAYLTSADQLETYAFNEMPEELYKGKVI